MITQPNPDCNTGLKCQTFPNLFTLVDSYNFSCETNSISDAERICRLVFDCYKDEFQFTEHECFFGKAFQYRIQSVSGCVGGFNPPDGTRPGQLYLQVKGRTIARDSQETTLGLIAFLVENHGARFTRMDTAVDDYGKVISPEQVMGAIKSGNIARFRSYQYNESNSKLGLGWCIRMGTRESPRFVRYYNKYVESCGEKDCYRWEAQFSDSLAQQMAESIRDAVNEPELLAQLFVKSVFGAVDFVDRQSGDRLERQERLQWWQEFIDKVEGVVRFAIQKPQRTLQRTKEWLERQAATSLAMMEQVMGKGFTDWLNLIKYQGRKRLSSFQEKIISVASAENRASQVMEPGGMFPAW